MTAIQSTTATVPANALTPAATPAGNIQDSFLKLLITQLKNQDPLNPMDNAQITTQLAQINTVNGIQQLNTTMQSLSGAMLGSQSLQSAALIGRTVVTDGDSLKLAAGSAVAGGLQLAQNADSVKVTIVGPAGQVVRELQLGPQAGGMVAFQWDGRTDAGASAAAGTYTFKVSAASAGHTVNATPLVAGTVSSVTLGADGTHLTVDGVGDVRMQQIKSIM